MSSLQNLQINQTYPGLIKTNDEAAVTGTLKTLQDGDGNNLPIQVSTTEVNFTGTVTGLPVDGVQSVVAGTNVTVDSTDPANPIVNSLPDGVQSVVAGTNVTVDNTDPANPIVSAASGGDPGLVNGTVADSLASAATLTTNPAIASATNAIAIGNGADATQAKNISIGTGNAGTSNVIIIGDADASDAANNSIAIGNNMATPLTFRGDSISIGSNVYPSQFGVFIGNNARHNTGGSTQCVAIGNAAETSAALAVSLGASTNVTANGGVALGFGITAAKVDTVSVKELETQTAGGGITLKSADLTEEKVTLTDADVLAIGGDTIPANDTATPTVVNRFWSGTQAQYDGLGTYDANTIYYIV